MKEEGGYAYGSQTADGSQTPAGQRLSQAVAKEAVTARHAHEHPCCAPCARCDITGCSQDVKTSPRKTLAWLKHNVNGSG